MTTQLTDAERNLLVYTRKLVTQHALPDGLDDLARTVADQLRNCLADLDDLTISRVIIQVAAHLSQLGSQLQDGSTWDDMPSWVLVVHLGVAFGLAATDLAGLELDLSDGT